MNSRNTERKLQYINLFIYPKIKLKDSSLLIDHVGPTLACYICYFKSNFHLISFYLIFYYYLFQHYLPDLLGATDQPSRLQLRTCRLSSLLEIFRRQNNPKLNLHRGPALAMPYLSQGRFFPHQGVGRPLGCNSEEAPCRSHACPTRSSETSPLAVLQRCPGASPPATSWGTKSRDSG